MTIAEMIREVTFEPRTITPPPAVFANLWNDEPDFTKLYRLTVADYKRWLRKQIKQNGRRAEVGNALNSPVDCFIKEMTGFDVAMLAYGNVEVTVNNVTYNFMSEACDLAYYLFDDNGEMITTASKALDMANLENPTKKLVA